MSRYPITPARIALVALLAGVAVAIRFAIAVTPFSPATQPVGYVAQDELTSYNLRLGGAVLFRGEYEREFWSGNLFAYNVDALATISPTPVWSGGAAHVLDQQGTDRRIFTLSATGTKIPFAWASLSASQQTSLVSSAIVDYLRGVRTGEGTTYRTRGEGPLGAIVHSRPYYLKDTTAPTVFVGANDGMLHAFNALTGEERWAYVPSMLIPKMKSLSDTTFANDYFVDGTPNVATILSGAKRILVGGLGAGGKGLYALDITGSARLAPVSEAAAANNILWEITPTTINNVADTSYANLGYTYSNPTLAKLGGTDVVIVGNGYNNGGDYKAYLYVINANTGALIHAIKAAAPATVGTGSATSPNGLSTPAAVDTDNDGSVDVVYAGDLDGTMWKFTLTGTPAASILHTTSPAQPITMTPAVAVHPNGGYMVNFATGALFTAADASDKVTQYAAYGVWDGAPTGNTLLQSQTLTERCYTPGTTAPATPCASRVRTVSNNALDYTPGTVGTPHNKGWRVPLPAGERVLGDGSFIENSRFYFSSHNPTIGTAVQGSTVYGENWLMELDYLTGGSKNLPFLDLSGNRVLDDDDRVKDSATPPAPVTTTDGIPVAKFVSIGVLSQPVLVQLSSLNNTLFNQNPDVAVVPLVPPTTTGVTGGHFDEDVYYGSSAGGASATATIKIGSAGQTGGIPATLGAISVAGITIVPALSVVDLPDGTATTTNATTITNKVTNGFTATVSGSDVKITAPPGADFNGKTITIGAGTSQGPLVKAVGAAGVPPTALITFSGGRTENSNPGSVIQADLAGGASVKLGTIALSLNTITIGKDQNETATVAAIVAAIGTSGSVRAYVGGNAITATCSGATNKSVCLVDFSGCTNGALPALGTITLPKGQTYVVKAAAGASATCKVASPSSGWTDFAPAVTATVFSNTGVDPVVSGDTCDGNVQCKSKAHFHQYDDTFDVTGVNMLNPSSPDLDIRRAIPALSEPFKVLAQNQYLSPAAKLHIGNPSYLPNLDVGYIRLRDYTASATLSLASLQTYVRNPGAVWPGVAGTEAEKLARPKPIGSLTMNLPVDALTGKDWWGNGDVRAGLHPSSTGCVNKSVSTGDGNMYQPVIPPAAGVEGPGVNGWKAGDKTPVNAKGVRHNGALVIQLVRANTPDTAIEMSIEGRPEFGWRVKWDSYAAYVLAEWTTFWHAGRYPCYGSPGWLRVPKPETSNTGGSAPAGTTDPKVGDLSAGGIGGVTNDSTVASVNTTEIGPVTTTTINYLDGGTATIVKTANADGSVTIVVRPKGCTSSDCETTTSIANKAGALIAGGDERGVQARTGRISWRELVAP